MKLKIEKEKLLAAVRREGDVEVGAGRIAFDPEPETAQRVNIRNAVREAIGNAVRDTVNRTRQS